MVVGQLIDVKELAASCRVFLVDVKQSWWDRILQRPRQQELLIFSKERVSSLPSQWPYETMPETLKMATPLERMKWREKHGMSFVCYGAKLIIDGQCRP